MRVERVRLEYKKEEESASIQEAIDFLKKTEFDSEKQYYEVEISDEIKVEEIRDLLNLPYEVSLTEHNGKVIMSTGTEKSAPIEHQSVERRYHSKLSLHTHIVNSKGKFLNAPSFSDVYTSEFANETTPLLLVTKAGILHYKKPTILEGVGVDHEARDIMLTYGTKKGVDIFGFYESDPSLKSWKDLDYEEKSTLQREFLENTGMIVKEAKWEDTEGIREMMDIINLKT